jgi:mercuric ion transport protein
MTKDRTDAFSLVGLGAAACVACCAGPLLAFLGGLGLAGVASTALIGSAGLAITAAAILAFVAVRRRKPTCNTIDDPAPVAAPQRRDTRTTQETPR